MPSTHVLSASSPCKFFMLFMLTLFLMLVHSFAVKGQDNTKNPIRNGNGNISQYTNGNANRTDTTNKNASLPDDENKKLKEPDAPVKDDLTHSGWFFFLITFLFGSVLLTFVYAITRAILFSKATFSSPLGLPDGSLRAMLAFMLVAYLGIYLYASILKMPSEIKIPDSLLGIVATVIGFYFGSRTSEEKGQGSNAPRVQGTITERGGATAGGASVELSQLD